MDLTRTHSLRRRGAALIERVRARCTPLAIEGFLIVVAALVALLVASHLRSTAFNNYVRLADSIRHGHLWIDYPGRWLDAVAYKGKHYGVDGPFPALLCLPLVLIWGDQANQTFVAIAVATLGIFLAWRMLVRLGVAVVPRRFLMLFLFAGTDYWWCGELGDVWFLAHLCAVTGMFAIFLELMGRRRGWFLGLLALATIESRNVMLLATPFVMYAVWTGDVARAAAVGRGEPASDVARVDEPNAIVQFGAMLLLGFAIWAALNEAMWGTFNDVGHTVYYHEDSWGSVVGSPFGLRYFPYQIYSFFVRAPEFVEYLQVAQWPFLKVNTNGIALTFTSPALLLACFARRPRRLVVWLWAATLLVAAPDFLYYLNGWYQFGMRHALDFEPFLLVLMALAVRVRMPRWGMALCVYSALVGLWGVWWWNVFMRTGG